MVLRFREKVSLERKVRQEVSEHERHEEAEHLATEAYRKFLEIGNTGILGRKTVPSLRPFGYYPRMPPLYPQYPAIAESRELAETRSATADRLEIQCASCKHTIGFKSRKERGRFLFSSGWQVVDLQVICPVCADPKSAGKTTWRALKIKAAQAAA